MDAWIYMADRWQTLIDTDDQRTVLAYFLCIYLHLST